jgi:hypothetical protein
LLLLIYICTYTFISKQAYVIFIFSYLIRLELHLHSTFITVLHDSLYHSVSGKPWEVGFGWQKSSDPVSDLPHSCKFSQWHWWRLSLLICYTVLTGKQLPALWRHCATQKHQYVCISKYWNTSHRISTVPSDDVLITTDVLCIPFQCGPGHNDTEFQGIMNLRDFKFSQWYWWRFKCSGIQSFSNYSPKYTASCNKTQIISKNFE